MKKNIILLSILILIPTLLTAQEDSSKGLKISASKGFEYSIKAGFNIGGTSPLPLPEEIRSIKSYKPLLSLSIEANVIKWLDSNWGIESGIRLENEGMETKARVKNYNMEMTAKDGGHLKGRWTGDVRTKVNHTYLTVPLLATYKISPRWRVQAGAFASYMTDGEFSGSANDGYLREDDPTGEKVMVEEADYDFSDDLSKFQWGAQLGGEWKAFKHFNVNANLTWGFNNIFKKDFETITFSLYPIYLNVGFGYTF